MYASSELPFNTHHSMMIPSFLPPRGKEEEKIERERERERDRVSLMNHLGPRMSPPLYTLLYPKRVFPPRTSLPSPTGFELESGWTILG